MATSGSYSANVVTNVNLVLEWQQKSQSVANNTTTISWTLKLVSSGGSILSNKSQSYKVGIGGTTKSGTTSLYITSGSKSIASGTVTVNHNGNGTFTGNSYFTCTYGDIVAGNNKTIQGSGSITPNAINRGAYFTEANNFADNENPKVYYTNPSGSNTTALRIAINKASGNTTSIIGYRSLTVNNSGSYTFNFTDAERQALQNYIPNDNTATVYFTLESTVGGYKFYQSKAVILRIVDSVPIAEPQLVARTTHATYPLIGNTSTIIKGYNAFDFIYNARGVKGATIVEKTFTTPDNGTVTHNNDSYYRYNLSVDKIDYSVKDSRGNEYINVYNVNMIPYVDLTCSVEGRLTINANDSAQTDLEITISGNYYNGSFGAQDNALTLGYGIITGTAGGASYSTLSLTDNDFNGNTYSITFTIPNLSQNESYTIEATASDKISVLKGLTIKSQSKQFKITPIFDWGENDFRVNVPFYLGENLLDDYVIETGTEAMGTNGTWYWRKWKSGRAECYGCRNYGNMAVNTTWGSLFHSTQFTQSFPSGLFVATPEVIQINPVRGSYGCWVTMYSNSAPTASTSGGFAVISAVSQTISQVYLSFNVIGRWK